MARTRHQAPKLKCSAAGRWWFRAYVDVLVGPGVINRPEKAFTVGYRPAMGKREAQQKMAEMVAELNSPAEVLQSQAPFSEVMDRFLKLANVKPQTLKSYQSTIKTHIAPRWGKSHMCDITPLAVEEWIMGLAGGKSRQMISQIRARFTQVWSAAQRWGFTQNVCPMKLVPRIRRFGKPDQKKVNPTIQQFNAMLAALDGMKRKILLLVVLTGLRIGEVLALRWRQFEADSLLVEFSREQNGPCGEVKTKTSKRVIHIGHIRSQFVRPVDADREDLVFPCSYDTALRALKAAGRAAGIDYKGFGLHSLRRMHNTLFRRAAGGSPNDPQAVALAMAQLGHADAATNEIYFIEDDTDLARRAVIAEAVMGKVLGGVQ